MSTLKLYLQNATIPYRPATARGTWDDLTLEGAGKAMGTSKSGTATYNSVTVADTTANWDTLQYRYSFILTEDMVFSGTVDGVMGFREASSNANAYLHTYLYLTVGQSDTVRAVLYGDTIDAEEAATVATSSGEAFSGSITGNVTGYTGDVLVLEVGPRTTVTASYAIRVYFGGTDVTDLTDGADPATYPGYISLTYSTPAATQYIPGIMQTHFIPAQIGGR